MRAPWEASAGCLGLEAPAPLLRPPLPPWSGSSEQVDFEEARSLTRSPGSPSGGGPAPHPCPSWRMTLTVQTLTSRSPTFPEGEGCGWTCPLVFPPTTDTQALLPSSLGLGACYLGAPAGFSQPWEMVVAVCRGPTQNLGAGNCSLQPPEARLSPRTLRLPPNPHGPASQDPGAPWSPASLLQPLLTPQRRQGTSTLGRHAGFKSKPP